MQTSATTPSCSHAHHFRQLSSSHNRCIRPFAGCLRQHPRLRRSTTLITAAAGRGAADDGNPWDWQLDGPGRQQQQRGRGGAGRGGTGRYSPGGGGGRGGRGGGGRAEGPPQQQQQQRRQDSPDFDSAAPAATRGGRGGGRGSSRYDSSDNNSSRNSSSSNRGGSRSNSSSNGNSRERVLLFQGDSDAAPGAKPGASAPAILLTRQIMSSPDWPSLQSALEDKVSALNAVHVSAAMHQLSRIVGSKGVAPLPAAQRRQIGLMVEALLGRAEEVAECVLLGLVGFGFGLVCVPIHWLVGGLSITGAICTVLLCIEAAAVLMPFTCALLPPSIKPNTQPETNLTTTPTPPAPTTTGDATGT